MNDNLRNLFIGIGSNIVFFVIGFVISQILNWWKWKKRLEAIERTAREDEIAICVRVGGNSDPVPDVIKFLREQHSAIKKLLVYNIVQGSLDKTKTAQSIVEDILEGLRAYGKGEVTRIHYFPSGMIAYPPILASVISNWGTFVVYHKASGGYVPLYEISKEEKNKSLRTLKPKQAWEVVSLEN